MDKYATFNFDKNLSEIETIHQTNLTLSEALEIVSVNKNLFYIKEDFITEDGKFKIKVYGIN
jgi:hypothetical protein